MQQLFSADEAVARFFLVVPPGLETLADQELSFHLQNSFAEKIGFKRVVGHGGIDLELNRDIGFSLNRLLKIPVRILLRIQQRRCRDFVKLHKMIQSIAWNHVIGGHEISWSVSSHKSRLKMKNRIEETCIDAFKKYRKAFNTPVVGELQNIAVFVRVQDDEVMVSIDTSGLLLSKRGYRTKTSLAPIRENLAAAMAWSIYIEEMRWPEVLLDGMAGSGTLLIEANSLFKENRSRNYAFESFNQKLKIMDLPIQEHLVAPFQSIAVDNDSSQLEKLRENTKAVGLNEIHVTQANFFEFDWEQKEQSSWLLMNPPYGDRLKIYGSEYTFLKRVVDQIAKLKIDRAAIVFPKEFQFPKSQSYRIERKYSFENGGIAVSLWHLNRKSN